MDAQFDEIISMMKVFPPRADIIRVTHREFVSTMKNSFAGEVIMEATREMLLDLHKDVIVALCGSP